MMDIYVANLRENVTEEDLIGSFEELGIVVDVRIIHPENHQTYAVVSLMPDEIMPERAHSVQSVITVALAK